MYSSSDRLIGMLQNTCVFQAEDIPVLNQLLATTGVGDIPERFKEEIKDIIDLMFICGNVDASAKTRIDSLYDFLSRD